MDKNLKKEDPNSNKTGHKPWEFITIILIFFPSLFLKTLKYYD